MDPALAPSAILAGLLINGLYSLILYTADVIVDHIHNQEEIYERLTKNKAHFASIIERVFQDFPLGIKPEEYCEFLKSIETLEIVKRIYSFGLSSDVNLNNLERIETDFCKQLTFYSNNRKEVSADAPQLFSILVECCLESLDLIIKEEQNLSAIDYKIKFYFKISHEKLSKYQEQLLEETKINRMLLR